MKNNSLQPNEMFDSLRGTARHIVQSPGWISWNSMEEYRMKHAGQRFILANITMYQNRCKEPIINIWDDLPLDHDHLLQCLHLMLKAANEFTGVVTVRADFAGDVINSVRISCMDAVDVDD